MAWQAWYLIALIVFGACSTILSIGKVRKPMTPDVAVVSLFFSAFSVYCILALAGVA